MADTLLIRPSRSDDIDGVFAAVRESINELSSWMPWCHPEYARSETLAWVESRPAAWDAKTDFSFVIESETGEILGACGLDRIEHTNGTASLGYWVRTSATGRGVATQATTLLREWAFHHTDLHRLEIMAAVGNVASQRVAEKAGATREGVLAQRLVVRGRKHDAALFSIIRGSGE
ncbi:MAG: GNAT family N-acetyltransferase [Planctomycetaceae bacterium]